MYKLIILIHLLAATIWTGGHLILTISVLPRAFKEKSVLDLLKFESSFEVVGIPALIIQVVSGVYLGLNRIPDFEMWFNINNPETKLILLKLTLLVITLLLALDARLRVIPNLTEKNLSSLAYHIVPVTIISILFVIVGVSFRTGSIF
jgi:putative copper export protein